MIIENFDYKVVFGAVAVAGGIISYAPYIYDLLKNKTKPHIFSWFIWGLMLGIVFLAQLFKGGGYGVWVTLVSAALSFSVFVPGFIKFETHYIKRIDWLCLGGAIIAILLWILTNNPFVATFIIVIADIAGFFPTFRKAYSKPGEETLSRYALTSVTWILAIIALQSYNLTTLLYPIYIVLANGIFAVFLFIRRKLKV